jgi:urea transport system permease protein
VSQVVRSVITALLLMLLMQPTSVYAADEAAPAPGSEQDPAPAATEPDLAALLRELTAASLAQTPALVAQLAAEGGRAMLPLFEAMLAGELYYDEMTLQLMRITGAGSTPALDVITGEELAVIAARDAEKIRINNRLRTQLREAIARINLTEGSDQQRRSAARALLGDISDDGAALMRQALAADTDAAVQELLQAGLAMYTLMQPAADATLLDAIAALDGRLENPVRNLLATIRDNGNGAWSPAVQHAADLVLRNIAAKIDFYRLVEQLFFGLSLGSVLLLAAIGLAVTFGVMGVINMAHGEMLMLGAYSTYVVQQVMPGALTASIIVALPVAFLVAATAGILIQRYVIRYLGGRPLETLLATFGISLILQQGVRTIFSPLNRRVVSPDWLSGSWQFNEVLSLTNNRIVILGFSLVVFAILLFILNKTSLGLNVRAVSQNRAMAQAMGIRTDYVDALTFGLGSGIAGIAGVALSQLTNVGPNLGQSYIIDSFMVVVFGGVGNLFGTLLAAFSLGVANKFLEPLTGAVLANILILVFIILFIQKRPKGLFPQKGRAAD